MKVLNLDSWNRKKHYDLFSSYAMPCYSLSVRLDMTNFMHKIKKHNLRFFPSFVSILIKVINEFEGFKLRIDDEANVLVCDKVDVNYTVLLKNNNFEFCLSEYSSEFNQFYNNIVNDLEYVKENEKFNKDFEESKRFDVVYCSCLPFIDLYEYSNPLPMGDHKKMSIPRINWGKCVNKNDKYDMFISFTVNHALVDGYELSMAINRLQCLLNKFDFKE